MANTPEQERTGDFGITEDLLLGMGLYYVPTNGSIGENPQKACVWHVEGPRGQEACVSECKSHESFSVDHLALSVREVVQAE